jgi:hypothetical protein
MPHLRGLTPAEAILGQRRCSCGRQVELVNEVPGPSTYQCPTIREEAAEIHDT